ncbi:MAG: hypothetical protein ACRDSP_00035 [Pseudonocardiaceae bacterium]
MSQQPKRDDKQEQGVVVPFPGASQPPDVPAGAEVEPAPVVLDAELVPESTVRPTPLTVARGERTPAPVDLATSPLPMWLTDRHTFRSTVHTLRRTLTHRIVAFLVQLPGILWWLGVAYPPRGLGRVVARFARFIYNSDTAGLRRAHAGTLETIEYVRISRERQANLHARWLAAGLLLGPVVVPLLAWTYPQVLAGAAGVFVFGLTVKLIPGRGWREVVGAAVAAVLTFLGLPHLLAQVPVPPVWPFVLLGTAVWLSLGWVGRPAGRKLVKDTGPRGGAAVPLSAPLVRQALCQIGVPGLKDPDSIRLLHDIHRHGAGVQVDVELDGGVAASQVVERRERLAAALKRELGTVWPAGGTRHAAHLSLYVCDTPMTKQVQRPWPLENGPEVDIFTPVPVATDQRGEWVYVTLAYAAVVIGAQPRMGKTFFQRELALIAGLDTRTKVFGFDGKGTGDFAPLRLFAHFYTVGDDEDEIVDRVLPALRELSKELRRRAKVVLNLPHEQCPESKVTSELASRRDLGLEPIVVVIDETQSYFSWGAKKNKQHKAIREEITEIVTDLVKRGPALGYIVMLASQNVCEETIPRQISTNAGIRGALKLFDNITNDQVLGVGAYHRGYDATSFDITDKGLIYLNADGATPQIVRSVVGLDVVASERIAKIARARREAKNRLTGYAAGEEAESEAAQADLLADCRDVMDHPPVPRMLFRELLAGLVALRPATWGQLDVPALGSMLRGAGVRTGTVWSGPAGRDGKGVKRDWLDVAATADEDPGDEPD